MYAYKQITGDLYLGYKTQRETYQDKQQQY